MRRRTRLKFHELVRKMFLISLFFSGKEGICKYNCKRNGACEVRFQKTSGTGSGKCVGSCLGTCYSPGFGRGRCGSSCSGTPTFCSECNCKCKGKAGSQFEEEV